MTVKNNDYARIEKAIHFISDNVTTQPSLAAIAAHIGLSQFHFQRLFRRWAGVSPKRFLEYLTVSHAKQLLRHSNESIFNVSDDMGLSSASRLHDHFVSIEAITPGEYKKQGQGLQIYYGIHQSPFGQMLSAQTNRGICAIAFVTDDTHEAAIDTLQTRWPKATLIKDTNDTAALAQQIFSDSIYQSEKIYLAVRGTNFQINVWKALLKIPSGQVRSYQQVATQLGKPNAYRAVATAIASNPVGFLIPCHRVLRSSGDIGEYHWGKYRKHAMVAWEAAKIENQ